MKNRDNANSDFFLEVYGRARWLFAAMALAMLVAVIYPAYFTPTDGPPRDNSHSSLKQLVTAHFIYAVDYDDCLPPFANDWKQWQNAIYAYTKNDWLFYVHSDPNWKAVLDNVTPTGHPSRDPRENLPMPSFRLNPLLCSSAIRISEIANPERTALIFEREPFRAKAKRPSNIIWIGMVSGEVRTIPWMQHTEALNPFVAKWTSKK